MEKAIACDTETAMRWTTITSVGRGLALSTVAWLLFAATLMLAADPQTYAQAEALIRQGQWDKGIALLQPLVRAYPLNPKVRNLMGIALTGKGESAKANEQFRQALKIDPRFYPALKNLAVNEFTLKEFTRAERDFTVALKLAPDDPFIHTYLGELAYARHNYVQAAGHYGLAGRLVLQDPQIALRSAESYLEAGRYDQALGLLKQTDVRRLDPRSQFRAGFLLARHNFFAEAVPYLEAVRTHFPDSYNAGYNLSVCYIQMNQYPSAIRVLDALRARGQRTAELDNLLAEAYEGNKQTQQALDLLREATVLAPEDENNYLDIAALCIDHTAYKLGLEVVNVGLHYRPESDRLIFQRGVLYALMDQFDAAERDFELSSHLAPEKDLAYVGLGLTYMQKSNLPRAIEVLRRRNKDNPKDYVLQYLLGEALIRSGVNPGEPKFGEAKAALEKSVKLNARFSRSQIDLAKIDLKENRVDEAIDHLQKARALDPNEKAVYSQLATAYRRKGKPEETAAMLAIVKRLNDEERQHSYRNLVHIVEEGEDASRPPERPRGGPAGKSEAPKSAGQPPPL